MGFVINTKFNPDAMGGDEVFDANGIADVVVDGWHGREYRVSERQVLYVIWRQCKNRIDHSNAVTGDTTEHRESLVNGIQTGVVAGIDKPFGGGAVDDTALPCHGDGAAQIGFIEFIGDGGLCVYLKQRR